MHGGATLENPDFPENETALLLKDGAGEIEMIVDSDSILVVHLTCLLTLIPIADSRLVFADDGQSIYNYRRCVARTIPLGVSS